MNHFNKICTDFSWPGLSVTGDKTCFSLDILLKGFPGGSVIKNHLPVQETQVWSLGQEDYLEVEIATHSSILAWWIPQTGSLVGYNPWGYNQSDTSDVT